MTNFITAIYSKKFIDTLPMVKFPLTYAMCDKNDYTRMYPDVLMSLQVRYGKLMSLAIYKDLGESAIKLYSFEVTTECHLMNYGTAAMAELMRNYGNISLSSLPESRIFYEKLGFTQSGGLTYNWQRDGVM